MSVPAAACVLVHADAQRLWRYDRWVDFDSTRGAEADARRYRDLFHDALKPVPGAGEVCTDHRALGSPHEVLAHLHRRLGEIAPGGTFFLAVVTHGDELPDLTGEGETYDQQVIVRGGSIADDEFGQLWARHPAVSVVSFADICHADTAVLYIDRPDRLEGRLAYRGEQTTYEVVEPPPPAPARLDVLAGPWRLFGPPVEEVIREQLCSTRPAPSRLAFAACQKSELAIAGADGGRFTRALFSAWSEGPDTYREWYRRTAERTVGQVPTLRYAAPDDRLLLSRPMSVAPASG